MGSYERSKPFTNEEGCLIEGHILLSRSADTLLYYRDKELIFSMDVQELENFVSMVLSTGYIEIKLME